MSDMPRRRVLSERTAIDSQGVEMKIVILECGHEQIGGPPYWMRECVECADEAKYGTGPAPRPPRES